MHICILRVINYHILLNLSNLAIWFLAKEMFFSIFNVYLRWDRYANSKSANSKTHPSQIGKFKPPQDVVKSLQTG